MNVCMGYTDLNEKESYILFRQNRSGLSGGDIRLRHVRYRYHTHLIESIVLF